jgi:predicted ATPase/DNA-binding CsgD family transcriptional regulator
VALLPVPLTSFVGRDQEAADLRKLLLEGRLVTITGPGGVGKTRLAVEVAREVAGQFPDGVCFVDLSSVAEGSRVPARVVAALDARQVDDRPAQEVLVALLAPRRMLLVLDNCEHVLSAVAELCGELLKAADDMRILATSREQLWVAGETRYRLAPLALPSSGESAEIGRSQAVVLFTERARRASPGFALAADVAPLAARVVARLDGMPLAIELAAARIEALGMAGLADRIDDALQLFQGGEATGGTRHRSLTAVAEWSYRLLPGAEQAVFRRLAMFPGPFTLEAAEAVAGPAAALAVLRLVDCSLLVPPTRGPDERMRYTMLETLRAYGRSRLADAGEAPEAVAAVARFALSVAGQAAAGLERSDQGAQAARWLDAEHATQGQALSWAQSEDKDSALQLATALAPWWQLRGYAAEGYAQLEAACAGVSPGSPAWAWGQFWLGNLSWVKHLGRSLAHFTAAYEATAADPASQVAMRALASRAIQQANLGSFDEADRDARQALALAGAADYPAARAQALTGLSVIAYYREDNPQALTWIRQAGHALTAQVPGYIAGLCHQVLPFVLAAVGDLDAARQACADGLAQARAADEPIFVTSQLFARAHIANRSGDLAQVRASLQETVELATRVGDRVNLHNCLEEGGYLCVQTRCWAEAVTLWAAFLADLKRTGASKNYFAQDGRHQDAMRRIEQALDPGQLREAEQRGAGMTLTAAVELVSVLIAAPQETQPLATASELTRREQELVILVAQGNTNAQIAARLFISAHTVGSHLDRIRDKTGCRRRADLTRLALSEDLI